MSSHPAGWLAPRAPGPRLICLSSMSTQGPPRVVVSQPMLLAAGPRAHLRGGWAFTGARNEGRASPS